MSAADEAWQEWQMEWVVTESRAGRLAGYTGNQLQEAAFKAGYRRALEDAAEDMDGDRTLWHVLEAAIERASGPASGADAAQDEAAKWVRDRAAAVAPRKDEGLTWATLLGI